MDKTTFNPKMILIDVDGTMVDSVPDLAWSVNQMMAELGRAPHETDKVRHWVGNGIDKLVHRALMDDLNLEASADEFTPAISLFRKFYAQSPCARSTVYDGVKPALNWFASQGYKLGCVTNKAKQFTTVILQQLGLYNYFEIIISGDSLPRKKPDPMPLLHAADFFATAPSDALMIGDSISDVKAARSAGFSVATLTYGYNHGLDIRDAKPDFVLDRMDELIIILG